MEARYTGTSQQHMDVIYIKLKLSCGKYDVKFHSKTIIYTSGLSCNNYQAKRLQTKTWTNQNFDMPKRKNVDILPTVSLL